jgi:hypothetical protein
MHHLGGRLLRRGVCGVGFLLLGAALVGCSSHRVNQAQEQSNLKPLATLYGQFIGQHRGQPPADEAQFKQFITSKGKDLLRSFNVSSVDELFVSSRDGKPYVVLYGAAATKGPPGPAGSPVVAYEQEGVGGKRFVASSMGAVEEVDEARFKQLVPGAA